VSEKDALAAEAELREAELSLKGAQAKQRSLSVVAGGDNLFWVRAPRAGTIVSLDVYASQEITPERAEPLLRISDMDEVLILADMLEADAANVSVGSQALIRTRDGVERTGAVQFVSSVMDPQRQTVGVRIKAANADRALKPNAFVEVTFQLDSDVRRVRVDQDAVVSDGTRLTVFVLEDSKRLQKQEVQPGRRRDGLLELRSGLAPGTRYVAKGALLLLNQVDLAD
jgi:cobalt-zinc-cadmium efflux system membrane fusion protein